MQELILNQDDLLVDLVEGGNLDPNAKYSFKSLKIIAMNVRCFQVCVLYDNGSESLQLDHYGLLQAYSCSLTPPSLADLHGQMCAFTQ